MSAKEMNHILSIQSLGKQGSFIVGAVLLIALVFGTPVLVVAGKKNVPAEPAPKPVQKVRLDISKLVWPSPPYVPRLRFLA